MSRLSVVAGLLLAPGLVATAAPAQAAVVTSASAATYEAQVIYQINVQRVKYKRIKVAAAACPDRYAESWAGHLATTGLFYHQTLTPILSGCKASRAAENLARGYSTAAETVAAWMASPGHRANVLDPALNKIGVAAIYRSGRWVVAANFTR